MIDLTFGLSYCAEGRQDQALSVVDTYPLCIPASFLRPIDSSVPTPGYELARHVDFRPGFHESGDVPVLSRYLVSAAPPGTMALKLSFFLGQRWEQSTLAYAGPGIYSFPAHIWTGYRDRGFFDDSSLGSRLRILTQILALDQNGAVIGEVFETVSLGSYRPDPIE